MTNWSQQDHRFMGIALQLARQGEYTARPNPMVGCVIVKNGEIVGQGLHQNYGDSHAEINALKSAGKNAEGSTCYVTLEPCAHVGKTGACALALVEAGVKHIVAAMQDPNPAVCGKGFEILNTAGISTKVGLLEAQARELNQGFVARMERGRAKITLKLAMSLDGRTALADGASQWITGSAARADVQRLRARHDAIITGIGTQLADNPSLTARLSETDQEALPTVKFRQPLRVLLDREAKADPSDKIFGKPTLFGVSEEQANVLNESVWWVTDKARALVKLSPIDNEHIKPIEATDLPALIEQLSIAGLNQIMVEAGHRLAGQFLALGLIDELVVYMAPKLMGDQAMGLMQLEIAQMDDCPELELRDIKQLGNDIRLIYTIKS